MNDSEFIALLNLYLDHEIPAADAARLEAEVQANPERQRIYEEYCRMQKACKVLAADFVTAEEAAATPANRKVVAFNLAAAEAATDRRRRAGNRYLLGAAAAMAACGAIVFVGQNRSGEAAAQGGAIAAKVESIEPARPAMVAAAAAVAPANSGPRALGNAQASSASTTLVVDSLSLSGSAQADALMVAAMEQARTQAQLTWIEGLKFAPIQQPVPVGELRFETASAPLRPEARTLGNRPADSSTVEMAAFQFRK
jgi:hypothetical protein